MTFTDIVFSIPGMLTIVMFTPITCIILIQIFQDFVEWTSDTIDSFRYQPTTETQTSSKVQSTPNREPVSIRDTEALAYISNHAAMRFHRKN
mgnify:FL=1